MGEGGLGLEPIKAEILFVIPSRCVRYIILHTMQKMPWTQVRKESNSRQEASRKGQ